MILYFTTADHQYTFLRYQSDPLFDKNLDITPVTYEEHPWLWLFIPAVYIFTDIERLSASEKERVAIYADHLIKSGYTVLNHPRDVLTRIPLQRVLYQEKINPFRVHIVAETDPNTYQYPVFLRYADAHAGSLSPLIYTPWQLAGQLDALRALPHFAENQRYTLLAVEFFDCSVPSTYLAKNDPSLYKPRYHKYSAMRVGTQIHSKHRMNSHNWVIKYTDILDQEALDLEEDFVHNFADPQSHWRDIYQQVWRVFELAHIDFGRIDFSIDHDADIDPTKKRIIVWEINTNPQLLIATHTCSPLRLPWIRTTVESLNHSLHMLDQENQENQEHQYTLYTQMIQTGLRKTPKIRRLAWRILRKLQRQHRM